MMISAATRKGRRRYSGTTTPAVRTFMALQHEAPLPPVSIDRSSPVPLYHQLSQGIADAIAEGTLPAGSRLENEVSLVARLNLSRPTVRRAIAELVDRGLLVRKRGVGTQVVQAPVHRPVELTSLLEDLQQAGEEPTTTLLDYRREQVQEEVTASLNLPAGTEVVLIQRLRLTRGEPLALMTNYLPVELAPPEQELARAGLYQLLRRAGVNLRVARQRIGATSATAAQARLLQEKPRSALLSMERLSYDDSGAVVEFGSHVYRASRYVFETTLVDR